jgi:HEPN domain-containing protein
MNYLNIAEHDLEVAKLIMQNLAKHDDTYLPYVGFWIEQAVEKALRYQLLMNGAELEDDFGTLGICDLLTIADDAGIDVRMSKELAGLAPFLDTWRDSTWTDDVIVQRDMVMAALAMAETLLRSAGKAAFTDITPPRFVVGSVPVSNSSGSSSIPAIHIT